MPLKHLCPEMHAMAILAKNHQMAGENLNEVPRSAPYKVEKVIKMVNLSLQLFQERLSQKLCTRQSRIVTEDMFLTM